MKTILLTSVLLTILSTTAFAQLPRVTVEGNRFVDANGKTIVFRGLCASDPDKLSKGEHWNKDYFAAAKSWGANIIRISRVFFVRRIFPDSRSHKAKAILLTVG